MSKTSIGIRRVGIAVSSFALVLGGTLVGAGSASAAELPHTGTLAPPTSTNEIAAGTTGAGSSVTYTAQAKDFSDPSTGGGSATVSDQLTLNINLPGGPSCNATGTQNVSFVGTPTVTVGRTGGSSTGWTAPTFTPSVSSSPGSDCADNILSLTLDSLTNKGSDPLTATDEVTITISGINYKVGAAVPHNKAIELEGVGIAAVSNATVTTGTTKVVIDRQAALPRSTNNLLKDLVYSETNAGSIVPKDNADHDVTLTLDKGAVFPDGMKPTVTVPAGYAVAAAPLSVAGGSNTYTFKVHSVGTTPQKLTMTVSGLLVDLSKAPVGNDTIVSLTSTVAGGVAAGPVTNKVLNVLQYNDRYAGVDRYDTAARIFADTNNGRDAVVASGQGFADALSGNYLAGQLDTGILLTKQNDLTQYTRNALTNNPNFLLPSRVFIVGGTGSVSQSVENEIKGLHQFNNPFGSFMTVQRLNGADRYTTNQEVNRFAISINPGPGTPQVLVASGVDYADALALGPIAYNGSPLVLTKGSSLSPSAAAQIDDFDPDNAIIAGGTASITDATMAQIAAGNPDGPVTVKRLGGADRADTSAAIAGWATAGPFAKGDPAAFVSYAVGVNGYADALSAGPLAGQKKSPILIAASKTSTSAGQASYLGGKSLEVHGNADTHVHRIIGLSGNAVTPLNLLKAFAAAIQK